MIYDLVIVGGGAAGFFTAINVAEHLSKKHIVILEKSNTVLSKVRISGGGRCNLTHAEYNPRQLIDSYPRGNKELLGPFNRFMTSDTIAWFQSHGVSLNTESDGRIFPKKNTSQAVIDCFLSACDRLSIKVSKNNIVKGLTPINDFWDVQTQSDTYRSKAVMISTGSSKHMWNILEGIGYDIISPVPSLFTFSIKDILLEGLAGLTTEVSITIKNSSLSQNGSLLITHKGLSGPVILKLSAFGARKLATLDYKFKVIINWTIGYTQLEVESFLRNIKQIEGKTLVAKKSYFNLPRRLWKRLLNMSQVPEGIKWGDLNKTNIQKLALQLVASEMEVFGKNTFKEEFVTAGGIKLSEIDFKTYSSKTHKGLYFAGEILNIDAITGGFNFQNAWTGAYIASQAIVNYI